MCFNTLTKKYSNWTMNYIDSQKSHTHYRLDCFTQSKQETLFIWTVHIHMILSQRARLQPKSLLISALFYKGFTPSTSCILYSMYVARGYGSSAKYRIKHLIYRKWNSTVERWNWLTWYFCRSLPRISLLL